MNQETKNNSTESARAFPWLGLFALIGVIMLGGLAYKAYTKTGRTVAGTMVQMAEKFKTGTITRTFVECIPTLTTTKGDVLELATLRSEELFEKDDPESTFWGLIYLGTTTSEIQVPATYRYYLRLSEPWRLASRNGICVVLAPQFHASTPTAIETDKMVKHTENGWLRFNKDDNLDKLEKSITSTLNQRAESEEHRKIVKESCRSSVAGFVQKWLVKEACWRGDLFHKIIVYFPDELDVKSDQELEKYSHCPEDASQIHPVR